MELFNQKTAGFLFLVLGFAVTLAGVWIQMRHEHARDTYVPTNATVLEIHGVYGPWKRTRFTARYTDNRGDIHEPHMSVNRHDADDVHIGESLRIFYDPENPRSTYVDRPGSPALPYTLMGIGLIMILIGASQTFLRDEDAEPPQDRTN